MASAPMRSHRRPEHSEIKHKHMRFLITDRPTDATIDKYIEVRDIHTHAHDKYWTWSSNFSSFFQKDLNRYGASVVVRVCEPSYNAEKLEQNGIKMLDAAFPDGQTPPAEIRDTWFQLLRESFAQNPNTCVAIHCVAGLGRAPVMVALALIELGMSYEEAVELIRSKRKGAINMKQLEFLAKYRPKNRLKKQGISSSISKCTIMWYGKTRDRFSSCLVIFLDFIPVFQSLSLSLSLCSFFAKSEH